MAKDKCDWRCWPLYIYVTLLVLSLVSTALGPDYIIQEKHGVEIKTKIDKPKVLVTTAVWGALWSYLLYWLCLNCHGEWAWIVLLFPFLIILGLVVLLGLSAFLVGGKRGNKENMNSGGVIDRMCAQKAEQICSPDMSSGPGTCYSKAYEACISMK